MNKECRISKFKGITNTEQGMSNFEVQGNNEY